jgi:5'-nucleotidase
MRILLSNDDGYQAEGLRCLADAVAVLADITVVAPDRDRSGASNSLTLRNPLRADRVHPHGYQVDGTPTDCVHLAITGLLEEQPDMVVSGINHGANLGDDVIYSGTVAAAMEGRFLGYPAIAVSLVCGCDKERHFATAARVVCRLIEQMRDEPLPANMMLNVNVPNVPYEAVRGIAVTRCGQRHKSEPVIPATDARGERIYWIGPAGEGADAGPGTDFHAVANGYVSVTPLQVDLTRYDALEGLTGWMRGLA